jgi:hypothetical protein
MAPPTGFEPAEDEARGMAGSALPCEAYGRTMALVPTHDPLALDWLRDSLVMNSGRVNQLVPPGFDCYLRLLHPAERDEQEHSYVRWADIAEQFGMTLEADTQLEEVLQIDQLGDAPKGIWSSPPIQGTLDDPTRASLAAVFEQVTSKSARIYFAVWEGYAGLPRLIQTAELLELDTYDRFHVLKGTLSDYIAWPAKIARHTAGPDIVWPEDEKWLVRSNTDLASTYIGCSRTTADLLSGEDQLELVAVSDDTSITLDRRRPGATT